MTLPIERARTRRPITWLTVLGVLLLPVLIGGILVAALYNPVERLENLGAAIVNEDEPVTIDDQVVPLGRQLTAGLVAGSDDQPSNLSWTISNSEDAAAGLADGTYSAIVTIPANFSAAATSTAPGGTPERATIEVETSPDALVVDDAITAQVTQTAAAVLGRTLSSTYLENVFLGFTTLGEQLGQAADGASALAAGAQTAADGAALLPGGATALAEGATQLSSGATSLASGLRTIATNTRALAAGANELADGLATTSAAVAAPDLVGAAQQASSYAATAASQTAGVAAALGAALQASCQVPAPADPTLCAAVNSALTDATAAATSAGTASAYATPAASGIASLTSQTSAGLTQAADGARSLGGGLTQLAGGVDQSAAGAGGLATGATGLSGGATQLGTGAQTLVDGIVQLATGTDELAAGLATAVEELPSYTDSEAQSLASVVSEPVAAEGVGTQLFGASAVPLLAALALWIGGLGTFVALQAVSRRALTSRVSSPGLALRAFGPAAVIGAVQGLLVAGVVQLAASYSWGEWWVFAAVCVAAGIAFAAVNQALVAVFGGAGRWVAALVGVLAVATGVVSTVPGVLSSIAALAPTAPAYQAMLAALSPASGLGAGLVGLLVWTVLALIVTTIAVSRRRTTSPRALRSASVSPA